MAGEYDMTTEIITKLNKLERSQAGMQAELKVFAKTMERLAATSEQIVELRAECLHMIKSHERSERTHDEMFNRLREVETWKGSVGTKVKIVCHEVDSLQRNQRWVVMTVIGALIIGFIGLGFGMARYGIVQDQLPHGTNGAIHG